MSTRADIKARLKVVEIQLQQLIALFTCPRCDEIKLRDANWNGTTVCRDCFYDACAGRPPRRRTAPEVTR